MACGGSGDWALSGAVLRTFNRQETLMGYTFLNSIVGTEVNCIFDCLFFCDKCSRRFACLNSFSLIDQEITRLRFSWHG